MYVAQVLPLVACAILCLPWHNLLSDLSFLPDGAVATDGASVGDTVAGYGTWDVGSSDGFSHWFRDTPIAPDGIAANVSISLSLGTACLHVFVSRSSKALPVEICCVVTLCKEAKYSKVVALMHASTRARAEG